MAQAFEELEIVLAANAEGLDRASDSMDRLASTVQQMVSRMDQMLNNLEKRYATVGETARRAGNAQEKAASGLSVVKYERLVKTLQQVKDQYQDTFQRIRQAGTKDSLDPKILDALDAAYRRTVNTLSSSKTTYRELADVTATLNAQYAALARNQRDLGGAGGAGRGAGSPIGDLVGGVSAKQFKAAAQAEREFAKFSDKMQAAGLDQNSPIIQKLAVDFEALESALKRTGLSSGEFVKSTQDWKTSLSGAQTSLARYRREQGEGTEEDKKREETIHKLKLGMTDLSKSVQVALGPLSGIAARLTAITALANRQNVTLAAGVGAFIAWSATVGKAISAGNRMERQLLQIEGQLQATGGAAGFTAQQINEMAQRLAIDTLASAEGARKATSIFLAFPSISGAAFERTLKAAQDLATVMGTDVVQEAQRFGRALEDPLRAMEGLKRIGLSFFPSEVQAMKVLIAQGKELEALSIIIDKLESRTKGASEAAAKGLSGVIDTFNERLKIFFENASIGGGAVARLARTIDEVNKDLANLTRSGVAATNFGRAFFITINLMTTALDFLIKHFALFAAAIGGVFLIKLTAVVAGFIGLTTVLKKVGTLLLAINMRGAIAGATILGATIAGLAVIYGDQLIPKLKEFARLAKDMVSDIAGLGTGFEATSDSVTAFINQITKLQKISPTGLQDLQEKFDAFQETLTTMGEEARLAANAATGDDFAGLETRYLKIIDLMNKLQIAWKRVQTLPQTGGDNIRKIVEFARETADSLDPGLKLAKDLEPMFANLAKAIDVVSESLKGSASPEVIAAADELIGFIDRLEEALTRKALGSLDAIVRNIKDMQKELTALGSGGLKEANFVRDLNQTAELIRELVSPKQFDALMRKARELGIALTDPTQAIAELLRLQREGADVLQIQRGIDEQINRYETLGLTLNKVEAGFADISDAVLEMAFKMGLSGLEVVKLATAFEELNNKGRKLDYATKMGKTLEDTRSELQKYEVIVLEMQDLRAQTIALFAAQTISADEFNKRIKAIDVNLRNLDPVWKTLEDAGRQAFDRIGGAMTDMFVRGEKAAIAFSNVMDALLSELVQMFLKLALFNPIWNALTGRNEITITDVASRLFGGAPATVFPTGNPLGGSISQTSKGGVFSAGIKTFGKGGIANVPTFFPMRGGKTGLMGEAGDELIAPIIKTATGDIGIRAVGGGGVTINIYNNTDAQVQAERHSDAAGGETIDIMVSRMVSKDIRNFGGTFRAIADTFGNGQSLGSR
jgi:hypothetical protein